MKRFIVILALAFIGANNMNAEMFSVVCESGQTLTYEITDYISNEVYVYGGENLNGDLVIPDYVTYDSETYSVLKIGLRAFKDCTGLTSVTMGNVMSVIGESAFENCSNLTSVTIGNSVVSISSRAFCGCSGLTETLTIPNSVRWVYYEAFMDCAGISSIVFSNSLTNIYDRAFANCTGLTGTLTITSPAEIGISAFNNCSSLTSVIIGDSVTRIGTSAWRNCSELREVTIGNSVTSISNDVFAGCNNLHTINFNATNCTYISYNSYQYYESVFSNLPLTILNIGDNVTSIPAYAFCNCSNLSTVFIPNSVTSIGTNAFYYVRNIQYSGTATGSPWGALTVNGYVEEPFVYTDETKTILSGCYPTVTEAVIPSSVTSIDDYAFAGCYDLASVTIPSSVTSIGSYAFSGCLNLTSVTIPNSVTSIGSHAFSGCSGLVEMTLPFVGGNASATEASESTLFGYIFGNTSYDGGTSVVQCYRPYYRQQYCIPRSLRSVTLTGSSLFYGAFYKCSMLTSVTIGNDYTSIGEYAFYDCSGLTEITIPNSVTSIGEYAFYDCSGLTEITIPNSVTSIGSSAFQNCTGLTTLDFNATNCTNMGNLSNPVFANCNNFTDLIIGDEVTNIPSYSFYNCRSLGSVSIPNSVLTIGDSAFYLVTNIEFHGTATGSPWGALSINGYYEDGYYYTSAEKDTIASAVRSMVNANIPNTVVHIGRKAFYDCDNLVSLLIAPSVKSIDNYAFYDCSNIATVTIADSVEVIKEYAFARCNELRTITIGRSVTTILDYAFDRCQNLNTVNYNATNCSYLGGYNSAFTNCSSFTTLNIGNNVTTIPAYAFNSTGLTGELIIPDSVIYIGSSSFSGCSGLSSITIGKSVTNINTFAFNRCDNLTTINFNAVRIVNAGNDAFYRSTNGTILNIGEFVAKIPPISFFSTSADVNIAEINVSSANTTFDSRDDCNAVIETATNTLIFGCGNTIIPNTVTSIGNAAFSLRANMTNIDIPNSVTSIGDGAFGQSTLTAITIPESLMSIGHAAFNSCYQLTEVHYTGDIAQWCNISFGDGNADSYYNGLYTNPLYAAHNLYINNRLVTDLVIPENITEIKPLAFCGATCLESVTIGDSVRTIGKYAFSQCSRMTTLTLGRSVDSIENAAFRQCCGLSDVYVKFTTPLTSSNYYGFGFSSSSCINATVWLPCGYLEAYTSSNWTYFNEIREDRTYMLDATSATPQYGIVQITQHPDCTDGIATISAIAYDHCHFVQWNDGNTDSTRTITVTSDTAFTASFISDQYTVSVVSSDETMGTVSDGGTFDYYTRIQISATANEHYHFVQWNDGNTSNPRTIIVTGDTTYTAIFAIDQHNIAIASADEFMGTVSEGGTYDYGTEIQISATASEHCHFVQWNDGNTDNPRTITVTRDSTFTAEFALDQHSIVVVSADDAMGTVSGSGTYDYGSEIVISATANEGHEFVAWTDDNTDNPRTIIVTGDTTYTATFAISQYTIDVASADESMGTVSEGGTYDYGTEIQISATASEHYHFVQWNDGNTDNPRTITVNGDSTYTAEFAIEQHNITVVSADDEMGTVSGSGTYDYGSEIEISATENEGHAFIAWNDGNTDNTRTITVTGDSTYTATFGVLRNVEVYSSDENMGHVIGSGEYVEGAEIQITAIPNEHYHFLYWIENDNPSRGSFSDNPLTIIVTNGVSYTAIFAIDQHIVTVVSDNDTMGTVLGSGSYEYGSEIEISANANNGYQFEQWDDGNTDNPRTITVTEDVTYTAQFAIIIYHTIVVRSLSEDWGTVSGGGTFPSGSEIQILAIPNPDYTFVAWTDGNTDNPRTIIVTEDAEYVAAFTWAGAVEQTNFTEIAIFPNPANDILNITSSEEISEIEIVNTLGQVVFRMEVNSDNAVCDVNDLTAGVYVVRLRSLSLSKGANVIQKKFIKE